MAFGAIAGALIGVAGNIIGSKISSSSTEAGLDQLVATIREGQKLALAEITRGKEEGLEFLDTGRESTLRTLAPLLIEGEAGANVLRREALADPGVLTAAQKRGLEEATRVAQNQLSASGLRGAGRTQSRILRDVTGDFIAKAQEANRSRSLEAANRLFSVGSGARTGAANAEFGTGANKANITAGAGTNAARVIENASRAVGGSQATAGQIIGDTQGNAFTASANVVGSTLGTIAANIADDRKRTSAFSNFNPIE